MTEEGFIEGHSKELGGAVTGGRMTGLGEPFCNKSD